MRILQGIEGLQQVPHDAVVTIGNFDGVHRGHQRILRQCRDRAAGISSQVTVVTFEPHPLTVLRPSAAAPRLTPAAVKQDLLARLGVDVYVVLPPTPAVLNLTAEEFWGILRDDVKPSYLIEGPDFTFGKNRLGTAAKLAEWAAGTGVKFELTSPLSVVLLDLSMVHASSSLIRWLLVQGRVRDAAICLGRPYTLAGKVIEGFQRGRTIGIPTANIQCPDQLVPGDGVYAARCRVAGGEFTAAVSIGDMPTFAGTIRQIEAHLLDFADDIYGQHLEIDLCDWLREQRKYSSVDALKAQIDRDVIQTRLRRKMDSSAAIAEIGAGG